MNKLYLLTVLALAANVGLADVLDSADFDNKYEGDVLPSAATPAWGYGGTQPLANYTSVSGGILTHDTASVGGFQTSSWSYDEALVPANGFTFEISIKVINSVAGADINSGYWVRSGESSGAMLSFFNDSVMHRGGGDVIIISADNTDDFHVYRTVVAPGLATFDLYRDGVLMVDDRATGTLGGSLYFGDPTGSGTAPDPSVQIDYVRWDTDGAYTPVIPEPATIGLFGLAGFSILAARRIRNI